MTGLLIGERYLGILGKSLEYQGFQPIPVPENPQVDPRLAGHVDLSVIKTGEKELILAKHLEGSDLVNFLTNRRYKVTISEREQTPDYPGDANLCACIVGKYIIHNIKNTDPALLNSTDLVPIDVKQCYAKCCVCAVSDDAIITADRGIARAVEPYGIKTLLISPGGIALEGFSEGFIGGASFIYNGTVYFTGSLRSDERRLIEGFIAQRGKRCVYLTESPIFDIGGAVVI